MIDFLEMIVTVFYEHLRSLYVCFYSMLKFFLAKLGIGSPEFDSASLTYHSLVASVLLAIFMFISVCFYLLL